MTATKTRSVEIQLKQGRQNDDLENKKMGVIYKINVWIDIELIVNVIGFIRNRVWTDPTEIYA